jgi:hypothetical protein
MEKTTVQSTDKEEHRKDRHLDHELEDTFPASDPPSMTDPTRGMKRKKPRLPEQNPPKGQKTGD